jgi:hypothetical protein
MLETICLKIGNDIAGQWSRCWWKLVAKCDDAAAVVKNMTDTVAREIFWRKLAVS